MSVIYHICKDNYQKQIINDAKAQLARLQTQAAADCKLTLLPRAAAALASVVSVRLPSF